MSTATKARRKDSGSWAIAGKTCAAITASSGRAAVRRSAASSSSSVITTRGRRAAVLLLVRNVFRSARIRYGSSSSARRNRGRERTLAKVSWTRSSAVSREPHSVRAARNRRPRCALRISGSSRLMTDPVLHRCAIRRRYTAHRRWTSAPRILMVRSPLPIRAPQARHDDLSSPSPPRFTAGLVRDMRGSLRVMLFVMSLLRLRASTVAARDGHRITQRVVRSRKARSHAIPRGAGRTAATIASRARRSWYGCVSSESRCRSRAAACSRSTAARYVR